MTSDPFEAAQMAIASANVHTSTYQYVRFGSHRARHYGFQAIDRTPQGFFSFHRKTGPGGVYLVSEAEIQQMRAWSDHARFTRLRGPFEDLHPCWTE